jgi:hypothetical protein
MTRRDQTAFRCGRQRVRNRMQAGAEVVSEERVDLRARVNGAAPDPLFNGSVHYNCLLCNLDSIVQSVG